MSYPHIALNFLELLLFLLLSVSLQQNKTIQDDFLLLSWQNCFEGRVNLLNQLIIIKLLIHTENS